MIQRNAFNVTLPYFLRNVPDEEIKEMIKTGRPLISGLNVTQKLWNAASNLSMRLAKKGLVLKLEMAT